MPEQTSLITEKETDLKQQIDEIEKETKQLEEIKKKLNELTKKRDATKVEIDTLQKVNNSLTQLVQIYGQAYPTLKNSHQSYASYITQMGEKAEAIPQDQKEKAKQEIEKVKKEIEDKKTEIESDKVTVQKARKAYDAANSVLEEKQKVLDKFKNYKSSLEKDFSAIKEIQKQLEQKEISNASLYFLIGEMKERLDIVGQVISQDELQKKLYEAWGDLNNAYETVREKEQLWKVANAKYEKSKAALTQLEDQRRENILKALPIKE